MRNETIYLSPADPDTIVIDDHDVRTTFHVPVEQIDDLDLTADQRRDVLAAQTVRR